MQARAPHVLDALFAPLASSQTQAVCQDCGLQLWNPRTLRVRIKVASKLTYYYRCSMPLLQSRLGDAVCATKGTAVLDRGHQT